MYTKDEVPIKTEVPIKKEFEDTTSLCQELGRLIEECFQGEACLDEIDGGIVLRFRSTKASAADISGGQRAEEREQKVEKPPAATDLHPKEFQTSNSVIDENGARKRVPKAIGRPGEHAPTRKELNAERLFETHGESGPALNTEHKQDVAIRKEFDESDAPSLRKELDRIIRERFQGEAYLDEINRATIVLRFSSTELRAADILATRASEEAEKVKRLNRIVEKLRGGNKLNDEEQRELVKVEKLNERLPGPWLDDEDIPF